MKGWKKVEGVDLAAAVPWDVEERKGRKRRKCREDAYLYGFFPPHKI